MDPVAKLGSSVSLVVSLELTLDFRRRLPVITRLNRFLVVLELVEESESELEEDEDDPEELSIHAATGPGAISSSRMCCGVD